MRKVIDSNFLQDERLVAYLQRRDHFGVLTDYAAMEAYKGDTLNTIYKRMEIISRYPKQIIVLKDTQTVCGLKSRLAGFQARLIDQDQTHGFEEYCYHLQSAKRGDKDLQKQLLDLGRAADSHLQRVLADASTFPTVFDEIAKTYSHAELTAIRTRSAFTPAMIDKVVKSILWIAALLFREHPRVSKLPTANQLPNTFIFRSALCSYLLAFDWISVGGAKGVKPEKIRNDLIDVNFAAYATYFDGILTGDKKLFRVYSEALFLLNTVFSST